MSRDYEVKNTEGIVIATFTSDKDKESLTSYLIAKYNDFAELVDLQEEAEAGRAKNIITLKEVRELIASAKKTRIDTVVIDISDTIRRAIMGGKTEVSSPVDKDIHYDVFQLFKVEGFDVKVYDTNLISIKKLRITWGLDWDEK